MPDTDLSPLFQEQAEAAAQLVAKICKKLGFSAFTTELASGFAAAAIIGLGIVISFLLVLYVKIATPLAVAVLQTIEKARKDVGTGLNALMGSALSEMLGVEISGDDLPSANSPAANTTRMQAIGNKVYAQFIKEFAPSGTVTPESGEAAAKAFTGFGINFAVTNSFISILCELVSDDHLEQWRELGVEIAQNLGLGRLQRRALGVLMQNVIEKPYAMQLQSRYRPDKLDAAQYVRAFLSGNIGEAELRKQLAYKGFADELIAILITQHTPHVTVGEAELLSRWSGAAQRQVLGSPAAGGFGLGDITPVSKEDAVTAMRLEGFDEQTAKRKLTAQALSKAEHAMVSYADFVEGLAVHGIISAETARTELSSLPLSPEDFTFRVKKLGGPEGLPRKTLTHTEIETAYIDGAVTLAEWDEWLGRQGYSAQDQQTLTLLLQMKADAASHKKAGHPAALTFAEISSAFADSFIDLAQAQAWMHSKGYSAHDQTVLTHLLQAKAAKAKPKA